MVGRQILAAAAVLFALAVLAAPLRAAPEDWPYLDGHFDGVRLDATRDAPRLLRREWRRIVDGVAAGLKDRPIAEGGEEFISADELDSWKLIPLDGRIVAVAVNYLSAGTAFLLGRDGKGDFRPLWSLDEARKRAPRLPGIIASWAAENATNSCRLRGGWKYGGCGPLSSNVGRLAPARDGSPRFYVLGTYVQEWGATSSRQFTAWAWRQGKAELLYRGVYHYMYEKDEDDLFADGLIRLREKHGFKAFIACGACEGRQMYHRLRDEGDRIVDLGLTSLVPDLDLVDAFLARILAGKPSADLAEESVAARVKGGVARLRAAGEISADHPSFGMYLDSKVTEAGAGKRLCLATDAASYVFTIAPGPRLTAVEDLQGSTCGGD